jgi:TP901 family phage tail tape measure protein
MTNVGNISATLTLNAAQFNQAMQSAQTQMTNTSNSAKKVSKDIQMIHNAALALGGAMVVGIGAAVTTAANFEQKMADVKAVSGATGDEMTKLGELAKEMGMKTAFSATEAAGGIEELIKAGLTVEQVINGGLEASLNLAVAGNLQLAEAAEIASTALNSFKSDGLSAADAANILAGAANASATDVQEMKFGLSMVSAVASGIGLTFRDTATSLALFAQNGLKGSDAGTSLKTMLLNLSPSTEAASEQMGKLGLLTEKGTSAFYDANGSIRSMAEIAELLQTKLAQLSDEQRQMALKTMFGTDAIRAANILYKEGASGIDAMWSAMSKVTALDVATVKIDTLKGAFNEFTSSLESVGISIGEEFLAPLTDLTRFVTELVRKFGEVDASTIKVGLAMAGASTAVLLIGTSIAKLSVALRAFALTPAGAVITALSVIGGLVAGVVVQQNEMSKVTLENAEAMIKQKDELKANITQYDELRSRTRLTSDELARFVDINSLISKTADPNIIAALKDEQVKLQEKSGLSNDELQRMVDLNGKIIETVPESNTVLTEQGNVLLKNTDKAKEYNKEQYEMIRLELEAQAAKAQANMKKYLEEEHILITQIKDLKKEMAVYDKEEIEYRENIRDIETDLAIAKEGNDKGEIERIAIKLAVEKSKLQTLQEQRAEAAGLIVEKSKELDKVQEQIGKLDEVKRKMIDLELKQAGINAKRGEELSTIELSLAKLEAQKRKLEETTPVAQRNSGEYRDAVNHIQNQIDKLNTVKSRIYEITGAAGVMNSELGKQIRKDVIIRQVAGQTLKQMPGLDYHTGGIVGRGQMPKLHTGGLASQFAQAPSHNEIDVRLLRGEAVLTEAQQANLMRMIDSGMTSKSEGISTSDRQLLDLLRDIRSNTGKGVNATVVMNEREVGRIVEPYVTEEQALNKSRRERF